MRRCQETSGNPGFVCFSGSGQEGEGERLREGINEEAKGVCVSLPLEENGLPVYFPPLSQEFQMNYIGVLYKII
jgi:hypothetical protein